MKISGGAVSRLKSGAEVAQLASTPSRSKAHKSHVLMGAISIMISSACAFDSAARGAVFHAQAHLISYISKNIAAFIALNSVPHVDGGSEHDASGFGKCRRDSRYEPPSGTPNEALSPFSRAISTKLRITNKAQELIFA